MSKPPTIHATREAWLTALANNLQPWFASHGNWAIPRIRVSVGWPVTNRQRALGECFDDEDSADQTYEIFVTPTLADPMEIAAVVAHELVHAVVGLKEKHVGQFRRVALAIGLAGKMTTTHAGEELHNELTRLVDELGAYPHAALTGKVKLKKDTTRMLAARCTKHDYVVRLTKKQAIKGMPFCPIIMADDEGDEGDLIVSYHRLVLDEPITGNDAVTVPKV